MLLCAVLTTEALTVSAFPITSEHIFNVQLLPDCRVATSAARSDPSARATTKCAYRPLHVTSVSTSVLSAALFGFSVAV